jgi:hypothetical protein
MKIQVFAIFIFAVILNWNCSSLHPNLPLFDYTINLRDTVVFNVKEIISIRSELRDSTYTIGQYIGSYKTGKHFTFDVKTSQICKIEDHIIMPSYMDSLSSYIGGILPRRSKNRIVFENGMLNSKKSEFAYSFIKKDSICICTSITNNSDQIIVAAYYNDQLNLTMAIGGNEDTLCDVLNGVNVKDPRNFVKIISNDMKTTYITSSHIKNYSRFNFLQVNNYSSFKSICANDDDSDFLLMYYKRIKKSGEYRQTYMPNLQVPIN